MLMLIRTWLRSSRAAVSCGRTERRNRGLHGVNEDFEHRPTATGSGAVDLEQVLGKRVLLVLCGLVLQVSTGYAQETLESVILRMKPQTLIKIHYQEIRYLELLEQPWKGSGYFFAMPDGMVKEQWYPQREIMAAKGSKMYYFDPFADVRYQGEMDGGSGIQAIAFKGLMNGDLSLLQQFFQTDFKSIDNDWVITLNTTNKDLAEQISKIVISGISTKPANKIEVLLADGDRHVFQLKKQAEGQLLQSKVTQLFEELQAR